MRALLIALLVLPVVGMTPDAEAANKELRVGMYELCGSSKGNGRDNPGNGFCIPTVEKWSTFSRRKQKKICATFGLKHHATGALSKKQNYCY